MLALGLGVAALAFGFMPTSSSADVSDAEAAALVGGGCTYKLQDTKCQDLTKTVVNEDGTVEEVACPSWPEIFRLHVQADDGTHKPPVTFIATCLGCGKFYKKVKCDPDVIDPTLP